MYWHAKRKKKQTLKSWNEAIIIPLYKKKRLNSENKIFSKILLYYFGPYIEKYLSEQVGTIFGRVGLD